MARGAIPCMLLMLSGACGSDVSKPSIKREPINESLVETANQPLEVAGLGESGDLPVEQNALEEGLIDPKSGQAAGQVLQSYAALLEQRRLAEARQLWTESGDGSGLSQDGFKEAYSKYSEIHAEIGTPGPVQGAAGSAYVEIPVRIYGRLKGGQAFSSTGTATLRRVNDVPGSTAEQRRWLIYRIDVQPPL